MDVQLVNDGPVTIILEEKVLKFSISSQILAAEEMLFPGMCRK